MIPFLKPKIWYAFEGLPIEKVGEEYRLPWSKCSVLTNNLMYILKFQQLTAEFCKMVDKTKADEINGVTFDEYMFFINAYLKKNSNKLDEIEGQNERNSFPSSLEQENNSRTETRSRGNTMDSVNVFSKVSKNPPTLDLSTAIKTFDEYVWTLYRTKKIPYLSSQSTLHDSFHNIWLMFITYSIKEEHTNNVKIPVIMDLLEAKYWCNRIRELLGSRRLAQDEEIQETIVEIEFIEFYDMIQDIFKNINLNDTVNKLSLQTLAEEALEGVTMKGPIKIDRYIRYCTLKSFILMIYNNKVGPLNFRSCFVISSDTEILAGTNKIQLRSTGLTISSMTIEINDIQLLNQWRTALTDAIYYSKLNISNPALFESENRNKARETKRNKIRMKRLSMEFKLEDERNVRCQMAERMEQKLNQADKELQNFRQQIKEEQFAKEELLKESEFLRQETDEKIRIFLAEQEILYQEQLEKLKLIENEKQSLNEELKATKEEKNLEETKRTNLEEKHSEAQQMLSLAEEKIVSLKKLGEQLERALEEEKQAKEDEEIVRNAAMALLIEEQQSKINLEKLLEEQKNVIHDEIAKSNQFSQALEDERQRIKEIAEEKEKLTKQLEDSQKRMQSTGNRVKTLDSKVSKIAENVFGKVDTMIPVSHRGRGFIAEVTIRSNTKEKTCWSKDNQTSDLSQPFAPQN